MISSRGEEPLTNNEKTRWREVLYDFTQNTTIHALRQITEPTPFMIRRVIWILILLLGMVVFLYQVVHSTLYYLSNPVAVNIMINYNDTLNFPAITICNQNAFRMTEAAARDQYHMIDSLFGHDHLDHISDNTTANYSTVLDSPISQMYLDLAHLQEDFIVSCQWEQQGCSQDDFKRTLTDHGVCYTFNNPANLSMGKIATQTGAQWGLRLRLNVEQYEYMMGPNSGAGVRVLVHEQQDYAQVGDHGQSVPPGLHAFLGIMIVQIHDLQAPHGRCKDDVKLEGFESYTQAACFSECRERMVREYCGCSHNARIHEAKKAEIRPVSKGYPPCTVQQHLDCAEPSLRRFREYRKNCICPYPCDRTHFDTDITYGDMSNFDMEKLLNGNLTALQNQYSLARETSQKVSHEVTKHDKRQAKRLSEYVRDIDSILEQIPDGLEEMADLFYKDAAELKQRIKFHSKWGLEKVKYTIEHDYIRGWTIVEERTFNHVATGFWEVVSSFDRVIEELKSTFASATLEQRQLLWYNVDDRMYNRLTMAERALTNFTEVNDAYLTGAPLLAFKASMDRRYDKTYLPIHLLNLKTKKQTEHFEECKRQLVKYISAIREMRKYGDRVVSRNSTQDIDILVHRDKFIKSAKMVNYNIFQFKSKILMYPLEVYENIMEAFYVKNASLWKEYTFMKGLLATVHTDIKHFVSSSWRNIRRAADRYTKYTVQDTISKSSLAHSLNSQNMADDLLALQHFFLNLRSRGREIKDSIMRLKGLYLQIFQMMVTEESTKAFYAKVHEDILGYSIHEHNASTYVRHFASFTQHPKAYIREQSTESLMKMLNGDFYGMNISEKLLNMSDFFETYLIPNTNFEGTINNTDEVMGTLIRDIQENLGKFTSSTKIGYDFFRENYLGLDIYMRELSYEAITQQVAYDLTNLWSDIGGSIGLFIGASAISVFEIVDIFVHTSMKLAREKHMKDRRRRASKNNYITQDNPKKENNKNQGWML